MKLITIFSNFIVTDELPLDNESLKTYAKQMCGGDSNFAFDKNDKVMEPLYSLVEDRLNRVHKKIGLSDDYCQVIGNAWINPSILKDISVPHNHPRYCLSAVYYISANSNSGDLMFFNPNSQHTQVIPAQPQYNVVKDFNSITSAVWRIKPVTGTLFIFPSWLFHCVLEGDDTDRISVAFDSKLVNITEK